MIDMPKLESPFLRDPTTHLVLPHIAEGFEWVFNDENTAAIEKIDGTNVSVFMEKGQLIAVNNRLNRVDCSNLSDNQFMRGIRNSWLKGWVPLRTGQHFGELMGPKIQGNFLDLKEPVWYSFEYMRKAAKYKAWEQLPDHKFETISAWFKNDIFSLLVRQKEGEVKQPEGVVFYHPSGRMAKLRLDMFDWWVHPRHKEKQAKTV